MKSNHIYMKTLRVGAFFVALLFWWISVQFSVVGFGITLPELEWIGWALALGITVLQLIFNRGVYNNPTLFFMGIVAYVYGVITNILGIMRAQQIVDTILVDFSDNLGFYVPRLTLAVVLALSIEIVPEALVLWSIFMDKTQVGDFVSSIFQGTYLSKKKGRGVPKRRPYVPSRTRPGRDRPRPGHGTGRVPRDSPPVPTTSNNNERIVIDYCNEHKRKHGNLPAVRKVEHVTGVPKSTVAKIMKPLRKKQK